MFNIKKYILLKSVKLTDINGLIGFGCLNTLIIFYYQAYQLSYIYFRFLTNFIWFLTFLLKLTYKAQLIFSLSLCKILYILFLIFMVTSILLFRHFGRSVTMILFFGGKYKLQLYIVIYQNLMSGETTLSNWFQS